ncbi:hypothetical protein ACFQJ7_04900 [Halovenus rubra]|uniref:CRISPR-associated exonuclease Cas4 n=2 Tax=Halovenus rubra TaxID=869890 RepID=A0ABD5X323_9EURY|nr:hypothetical protein [Halovenus rubra]
MNSFRAVETAAYCPRKLYYRQQSTNNEQTPPEVQQRRTLAFEYDQLLAERAALEDASIEVTPTQYRSNLGCVRARLGCWDELVNPSRRNVYIRGQDCHGIVHKILDTESPTLSLVFTGRPAECGVWESQSVRLVAAAKALSWELERSVERAFAEYPAYGLVREIDVDSRRTATYRSALRTAKAIDGPPAKAKNRSKCSACEYQEDCGVKTRSLGSLLGG